MPSKIYRPGYEGARYLRYARHLSCRRSCSRGKVGCGTALPTAYILRALLSSVRSAPSSRTILHVQDYNRAVLELVTLPNLILAALPYLSPQALRPSDEAEAAESVTPDLEQPGDLRITSGLIVAFRALLEEKGVELRFSCGDWSGLAHELNEAGGYGMVMTAETIYAKDSAGSLIDVLRAASYRPKVEDAGKQRVGLEDGLEKLNMSDHWAKTPLKEAEESVILVAAKVSTFSVDKATERVIDS